MDAPSVVVPFVNRIISLVICKFTIAVMRKQLRVIPPNPLRRMKVPSRLCHLIRCLVQAAVRIKALILRFNNLADLSPLLLQLRLYLFLFLQALSAVLLPFFYLSQSQLQCWILNSCLISLLCPSPIHMARLHCVLLLLPLHSL